MNEKSQSGTYLISGFALCTIMLCAMSVIAYWGITMQRQFFDHYEMQAEATMNFLAAGKSFDAMKLAAVQLRETGDEEYLKVLEEHFMETAESLEEARRYFYDPANIERTERLRKYAEEFRQLNEMRHEMSKRRQTLSKSVTEVYGTFEKLANETMVAQDKIEETEGKDVDGKRFLPAEAVQRRKDLRAVSESIQRLEFVRNKLTNSRQPEENQILRKDFEHQATQLRERIEKVRKEAVLPEIASKLDAIRHSLDEYHVGVEESAKLQMEAERVGAEMDKIAMETVQMTDEIEHALAEHLERTSDEIDHVARRLIFIVVVCGIVGVCLCVFTCFFVARKLRPKTSDIGFDPYSPTVESSRRDLSVVADKLQEVVDLLRR